MGYVLQYTVTTFKVASHKLLHVVQYRHMKIESIQKLSKNSVNHSALGLHSVQKDTAVA